MRGHTRNTSSKANEALEEFIAAMERANFPAEMIYAVRKTDLIVTEMNRHLISKADMAEWMAAIQEYRTDHPAPRRTKTSRLDCRDCHGQFEETSTAGIAALRKIAAEAGWEVGIQPWSLLPHGRPGGKREPLVDFCPACWKTWRGAALTDARERLGDAGATRHLNPIPPPPNPDTGHRASVS